MSKPKNPLKPKLFKIKWIRICQTPIRTESIPYIFYIETDQNTEHVKNFLDSFTEESQYTISVSKSKIKDLETKFKILDDNDHIMTIHTNTDHLGAVLNKYMKKTSSYMVDVFD